MKIVVLLIAALFLASCQFGNPGNGEKVGQVAKVTSEGLMCKTLTVLVTGKYGGGELHVTVPTENDALANLVRHFQDTQEQVKVKYHSEWIKSACSNETSNVMMDDIEGHPEGAAPHD